MGQLLFILFFMFLVNAIGADNFLVLGDWGGSPIPPYSTFIERSTAAQMARTADEKKSKFVIALGDNFYVQGVKNEYDHRFEDTYSAVFNETSLQVPWFLIAGNHDHYGNASAQIAYQNHSNLWKFPDYWYSQKFTFEDTNRTMMLVMLDTVLLCGNTKIDDEFSQPNGPEDTKMSEDQWAWLENVLANSKDDYLMVAGHFPVWSIAEHGPTQCLVDRLKPMLEQYKVTAYLSGHDHNLQHIREDNSDVHYFVIGCANYINTSQKHEDMVEKSYVKFFWADLRQHGGFGSFDVSRDGLMITFFDSSGNELHQQVLNPRNLIG